MLKWAVMPSRRDADKPPHVRRSLANIATNQQQTSSPTKTPTKRPKRRHSTNTIKTLRHRHSTNNKENEFTASTPITSFTDDNDNTPTTAKMKKKKDCLQAAHHKRNYFLPFETVDSHIGGILDDDDDIAVEPAKRRKLHAPTLPTLAPFATPAGVAPRGGQTPLGKMLTHGHRSIAHVNDFLHQITNLSEEEDQPKVSPLVKKLVGLHFRSLASPINSSFDDLSLDRIVEAIVDSSPGRKATEENDANANWINAKRNSLLDSGFRGSASSHQLEGHFQCKCTNRTIIDVAEAFNERCVDGDARRSLKRSSSDGDEFPLKRQRCIRKRKTNEEPLAAKSAAEMSDFLGKEVKSSTPLKRGDEVRPFRRCLLFESHSFDNSSICSSREVRGSMDLAITHHNNEVFVNVIRCKDLCRLNGAPINAYVKVAMIDADGDGENRKRCLMNLQRTPVQAGSARPFFNHTFRFEFKESSLIYIEVWHRDRSTRTSELLGCMSFGACNDINGSYRLLPPSAASPQHLLPLSKMCDSSLLEDDPLIDRSTSKISEQQKHADENLFLRYLELDPVEGPDAIPAALQRKATGNKNGKTPFTTSIRLVKQPKAGFGFSVVWTHPPRIERVEKGLPADRAGVLPGDYIIFVDKHNVVMMPEIEILNLIRSFGSQLTLEVFRRNASRNGSVKRLSTGTCSTAGLPSTTNLVLPLRRPSTVCSTNQSHQGYNRDKLHLPQVTFCAEKSGSNPEENRRKAMLQLVAKEHSFAKNVQFALTRYVAALAERKDLISASEHKTLFQNSDEILRITEDILDSLEEPEPRFYHFLAVYHSKLGELMSSYRRFCSGIKKADCVLANKLKNAEFVRFLQAPSIPKRRPDLTSFIHKPLEHYREMLQLLTIIQGFTKANQHEEFTVINKIVHELQSCYREMTAEAGLMEPLGEGRPLLSVQDLENRLVFTKCKPFVLNKPGREWIFGGDLARIEGRNIRQYWTLLFSDLLLFAKVSRDRVLFIMEDPIPLAHITEMFFNIRKKDTEFRIVTSPDGNHAKSPTVHCGPHLTSTPKKNANKRSVLVLRAPTSELKAVWQNLLQRQIFQIGAALESSSFSSPLESPDAPITSLHSAESPLYPPRHHQTNINESPAKCKQLKSTPKGNAIHLEKWIKSQLLDNADLDDNDPMEEWSAEQLRQRSEELQLIDAQGNITASARTEPNANELAKSDDVHNSSEEQSPSKSTESQVTVRSSPLVPETVPVCRQCHHTCHKNAALLHNGNAIQHPDDDGDWRPFLLMGLSAISPAACLLQLPLQEKEPETPDDSPQTEEHPYHSLSSSNLTLRRYGTVSSLEKLDDDEESDSSGEEGMGSEAFYHASIRNWTAKAGSFVAEKMAFFTGQVCENGDECQEEETSGATSGEEVWGTPTSELSSPNYEGKQSPYNGSVSSENDDDTELMMDELLMTPPISGAMIRGLLPRRTLEPLIEEDGDSCCSSSGTPTEPSTSPEQQGNAIGAAADTCSIAAAAIGPIHRSESYRRIVDAAEEEMGFFNRFRPSGAKFVNIERVPRTKSVKIFEFFNVRRERRIHQSVTDDTQLIKVFSKEGAVADSVPTSYAEKPTSPRQMKDKQMDRRFWKQLSKRRGTKLSSSLPSA